MAFDLHAITFAMDEAIKSLLPHNIAACFLCTGCSQIYQVGILEIRVFLLKLCSLMFI